mgnify:CR=1 FL=1
MSNETPTVSTPSALKTYIVNVSVGRMICEVIFSDEIQASSEEEAQEKVARMLNHMNVKKNLVTDDRFEICYGDSWFDEMSVEPNDVNADCDEEVE